jgi:hypothetical protein
MVLKLDVRTAAATVILLAGCADVQAPATSRFCDEVACDDDDECTTDTCNPADGQCSNVAVSDGAMCDFDGAPGQCVSGACQDGALCEDAAVRCDDDDECTTDTCNPADGQCSNVAVSDGAMCDFDGAPGQCVSGACQDAALCEDAAVRCDDEDDCTDDTCNPADGQCSHVAASDGDMCDFDGTAGVCMSGVCEDAMLCSDAPSRCDDDETCTADTCDPANGVCSNDPRTGTCHSELIGLGPVLGDCVGGMCAQRFCNDDIQCNDNRECTDDACVAFAERCTNTNRSGSCNSGQGICLGGNCIPSIILPPPLPPTFDP